MKLLTHNMLTCAIPDCVKKDAGFPLVITEVEELENEDNEFNKNFLVRMLPRLEYAALVDAAAACGVEDMPEEMPEDAEEQEEFLQALHGVLNNVKEFEEKKEGVSEGRY
eukprot:TRINITY_DN1371_c0_g1_i1.p2 TRINITY_DN1371_c0_g1~~TRINITY_DN1371_c0_g1_i1.p2  ORF type:complete len:110 (-),score=40.31 TRINITY_DN1371_c0_g1_i1:186-515(-)